jgi:hypothetical protein
MRSSAGTEFERLVRRRLVSAAPQEAPFSRCAKLAGKLSGSADVERAHEQKAADFEEYGTKARSAGSPVSNLSALHVSAEPVIARAKLAWPFVRDGYTKLVQTSLDAKEAVHPVAPSRPALGKGLPGSRSAYRSVRADRNAWVLAQGRGDRVGAYRSTDGGLTFKAWPTNVDSISDRCAIDADGRGFAFGTSQDGSFTTITSTAIGREPAVTPLMPASYSVVAAACDAGGLAVLARGPKERAPSLYFCEYERSCGKMAGPNFAGLPDILESATDVARVSNVTVLAFAMGKLVRVSSSRDRGQTWTPLTVAFDDEEHGNYGAEVRAPTRLLALGKRLILYGAAQRASQSYGLLVSEDQGASFRAP